MLTFLRITIIVSMIEKSNLFILEPQGNKSGVAYSKDFKKAFSTTSPILDYNAPAVMAHLKPILKYLLSQCPEVEHLHLLSDSVSSQYRIKSMFFFISRRIPDLFPQFRSITWNYSESGHGKNAADGVGGTLKRVADEVVAQENDINNYDKLMEVLQLKVDKIIILPILRKRTFWKSNRLWANICQLYKH